MWWRTLGALVLVVALIFGLRWVLRRTSRLRSAGGGGQVIEVLSRTSISPRQSLLLVRVGQSLLVVGAGETLTTLAQIDDPTQVAELLGSIEQARANSLTNTFARALGQWRTSSVDFAAQSMDSEAAAQTPDDATGAPRTAAGGAAERLRGMAEKVREVGKNLRGRP
jgi:flagellar protein FliO/FliZ